MRPTAQQAAWPQPVAYAAAPQKKSHTLRNVLLGITLAFFVLIGGCMALIGTAVDDASNDSSTAADREGESGEDAAEEKAPAKRKGPTLSAQQEQAVGSAEDYLDYTAFSKKGLIRQLAGTEGYSRRERPSP